MQGGWHGRETPAYGGDAGGDFSQGRQIMVMLTVPESEIEIPVRCDECSDDLVAKVVVHGLDRWIEVATCQRCLTEALAEAVRNAADA